jgi:hypothetical protein
MRDGLSREAKLKGTRRCWEYSCRSVAVLEHTDLSVAIRLVDDDKCKIDRRDVPAAQAVLTLLRA